MTDIRQLPTRWLSADGWCVVELTHVVIERLITESDDAHPFENGASLYGCYSDDQRVAYVEGLAPTPTDSVRRRFGFRRGVVGLADFFKRLFVRTKGESYYVGEFHSHPGGAPRASSADDAAQYAIASNPACQCEAPVLVIVGGSPGVREIGVYVHTRSQRYALRAAPKGANVGDTEQ